MIENGCRLFHASAQSVSFRLHFPTRRAFLSVCNIVQRPIGRSYEVSAAGGLTYNLFLHLELVFQPKVKQLP